MRLSQLAMIDWLTALIAWCLAIGLRIVMLDRNAPEFWLYAQYGVLVATLTIVSFSRVGLYDDDPFRRRSDEIFTAARANVVSILSFILIMYFFASNRISRGTLLIDAVLSTALFSLQRFITHRLRTRRRARTDNRRPVILIGNGEPLREYVEVIRQNPQLGIEILGWVDGPAQASTPALQGSIEELRDRLKPEAFVISYAAADNTKIDAFLKAAYNDTTKLFVLPDLRSYALLGLHLEDFSGIPLLALNQPKWSTLDLAIKRSVDILGSALGLLILSPFLMAIALAVKLTSSGPIFFGQLRMGLDGQQFKMWKFRTMRDGPAHAGWTIQNDPRRTKIGSFLRVTSIDELPQLWNILVGEMSLVGPRPEQPYFVENFKNDIPAYMLRHRMKAGLTGWAQVNGWRGDTSLHKRIECDLYYIRNWSVAFDFKIILLTIWRGFVHKNAY